MSPIIVFLSDIHIGVNAPTNWYQKTVHQKYLKAILRYIRDRGSQIQDLVILGDWFDIWTYPPNGSLPTIKDIFNKNKEIFSSVDDSGDFISCLDSIRGQFYYIRGNHDIRVSLDEVNAHFRPLSRYGREIRGEISENNVYQSGEIYAEHGHVYSLFCRGDQNTTNRYRPLPLGYYILRTAALICKHKLVEQGLENAALLPNFGGPVFNVVSELFSMPYILGLLKGKMTLAQAVLFDLVGLAGERYPINFVYTMEDWSQINAFDAAAMFPGLSINKWNDFLGLMVDVLNELDSQGEALTQHHKIVVLGHTHIPKIVQHYDLTKRNNTITKSVYINTGYLCACKPYLDSGRGQLTFAEVEKENGVQTLRLKKVDYPSTNIVTLAECTLET